MKITTQTWMMLKLYLKTLRWADVEQSMTDLGARLDFIHKMVYWMHILLRMTGTSCHREEGRAASSIECVWVNFNVKRSQPWEPVWWRTGRNFPFLSTFQPWSLYFVCSFIQINFPLSKEVTGRFRRYIIHPYMNRLDNMQNGRKEYYKSQCNNAYLKINGEIFENKMWWC